jgi:NitT/TauT family transport system permease protein
MTHGRTTLSSAWEFFGQVRRVSGVDLLLVLGLVGLVVGLADLGRTATQSMRETVAIDLDDFWSLPQYTFYSLSRGLIAYVFSLGFTLVYGFWAAKDPVAEKVLVPLLDVLQSIPVLSFLPGIVLGLVALFPRTNVGLELAAVLMIFTGQAWNMTFSFYHSLRSVPPDLREAGVVYRFSWWQCFHWLELPYATMGLVWNSMMSMAGGWFFLMIAEAFQLGGKDFRLPGLGSYMSVAVDKDDYGAMARAIVAMVLMIVALDQFLWRPVVVWAQKFRMEEGGRYTAMSSWFLDWLRRSRLLKRILLLMRKPFRHRQTPAPAPAPTLPHAPSSSAGWPRAVSLAGFAALMLLLAFGAWKLVFLLADVTPVAWGETVLAALATLGRVLLSTALGTLLALPAGLAIGLSARLSRLMQPVLQVLASFPAPMLFPLVVMVLHATGVPLGAGSIFLMLLGTQWYILFNVVAGAMAIPADLREMADSFRLSRWQRFCKLYVPAVFPYLVTGWVTAAGGAWNASIVSEYVVYQGKPESTWGIGAQISHATSDGNFGLLAASTVVMAVMVVAFNRIVWRQLYALAERRYSLSK